MNEIYLSPAAPAQVARQLIERHLRDTESGLPVIRYWNERFYVWDGSQWSDVPDGDIRAPIWSHLKDALYEHTDSKTGVVSLRSWNPNKGSVANVLEAIAAEVTLRSSLVDGEYIGDTVTRADTHVLYCKRKRIEISSYIGKQYRTCVSWRVTRAAPDYFNLSSIDVELDETDNLSLDDYRCPAWEKFLLELWDVDQESIDLLQEYMGYLVSGGTSMQKMLLLIGPKRAGKGTIAKVMSALVGERNTCSPTLSGLSDGFGLAPVIGKKLALIADARFSGKDHDVLVERLLNISGEDHMTIDRKYREPWRGKLTARFVIISNRAPALDDASGTVASRFLKLQLQRSWFGKEDTGLADRLADELPGILMWALKGNMRLLKNGEFTVPVSAADLDAMMTELSSPIGVFINETVSADPTWEIPVDVIYDSYRGWCSRNGRKPVTVQRFGADLKAACADIGVTVHTADRREDGKRYRVYTGIRLMQDNPVYANPFS